MADEKIIQGRSIQKHDTETNWLKATNFTPKKGEIIIYDRDSTYSYERMKIGDGITNVNELPFITSKSASADYAINAGTADTAKSADKVVNKLTLQLNGSTSKTFDGSSAQTFNVPAANSSTLGLVKTGGDISISNGIITVNDSAALDGHSADYFAVQSTTQAALDTKYAKPSTGIPKTDLASTVQTSLGKADTAVQPATLNSYALKTDIPTVGDGTITINQKGTKVGSFTVNQSGNTTIDLADTDTDTKVKVTTDNTSTALPLLLATGNTAYTGEAKMDTGVTLNTATNTINANISGQADSAKVAESVAWDNVTGQPTIPTAFNITATATDDDIVVLTGNGGSNSVSYTATHATKGPSTTANTTKGPTDNVTISGSGVSNSIKIPAITVDKYGHTTGLTEKTLTVTMPTVPSSLKNPKALSIGDKSYDGSSAVTITAADLGLSSAMKFLGTTTTAITDGSTTSSITIGGTSTAVTAGNVVLYGSKEFVWTGSKWEELGNEGSYKIVQEAVTDPTSSGTATSFIATISQDANGKITATKSAVANATTSAAGLMSAEDKIKLNGIAESADNVSVSQSLTSGTQIGTVTINGTATKLYAPTNTDTHYTSKNVVGSSTATSNTSTALTNGNVYLNSVENGAVTSAHKISGSGTTTVTTDTNGNIIITSNDQYKGDITGVTAGSGLAGGGTSGAVTLSHADTSSQDTLTAVSRRYVTGVTLDDYGHVTGLTTGSETVVNTDTKVTSAANHYDPAADSTKTLSADASSTTAATWGSTDLVTGVNIQRDAKGHVTGVTVDSIQMPSNPNSDTKVTQTLTSTNANYPVLLAPSGQTTTATTTSNFGTGLQFNPSTKTLTTNTFKGALTGNADTATKLGTADIGSATQPMYLDNGTPKACTYTLGKSVPSDAKFTDTKYTLPTASSSTLGGVKIGSNLSISNGVLSVPTASGTQAGATIVYPAASCTTFSSDSGTVTPLAVQKGAKMFSITRPSGTEAGPIARFTNTTGDVEYSKIKIENVTNTRDTSKTAQVISIPAEGGKKMVYGYCTDQVDGTSFIGGVFDSDATEFPYNQGLAIGGTSGNLLYKGKKVITVDDLSTYANQKAFSNVTVGSTTIAADTPTDTLTLVAGSNISITPDATNDKITIAATNSDTKNTTGTTNTTSKIFLAGATSQAANPQTYSNVNCYASGGYLYSGGQKQYTTTASATISASSWSSGVYTYSNAAITADSIIEIIPATSITAAQLTAFQTANVVGTAQAAGSVTMTAFGTAPSIDIPVVFVIRG